jgi:hypothetical protein
MAFDAFVRAATVTLSTMCAVWLLGAVPAAAQPSAISVDGISERGAVIYVNVTYRCIGAGHWISVGIDDPRTNQSAQGATGGGSVFNDGSVGAPSQLMGDGQPHSISVPAPANQQSGGPPWTLRRGELVRVRVDLEGPTEATNTRVFQM